MCERVRRAEGGENDGLSLACGVSKERREGVAAEVELEGVEPFELFYEARTPFGVWASSASGLRSGRHKLDIPLGEKLSSEGGSMVVRVGGRRVDDRGWCVV